VHKNIKVRLLKINLLYIIIFHILYQNMSE